jgi:hypothetical protein
VLSDDERGFVSGGTSEARGDIRMCVGWDKRESEYKKLREGCFKNIHRTATLSPSSKKHVSQNVMC